MTQYEYNMKLKEVLEKKARDEEDPDLKRFFVFAAEGFYNRVLNMKNPDEPITQDQERVLRNEVFHNDRIQK